MHGIINVVILMSIKKLLLINFILLIAIVFSIIGLLLFNNYLYSPYDPFNDLREFESRKDQSLSDSEIPAAILKGSDNLIEEYNQKLESKDIKNIKFAKSYTIFDYGEYFSKYILVDIQSNKIIADIELNHKKNGLLKGIAVTYRYFNDEDFMLYNECLINIKSLSLSSNVIEEIIKNSKEKPRESWYVGNTYKYEYSNREPSANEYIRVKSTRIVVIKF